MNDQHISLKIIEGKFRIFISLNPAINRRGRKSYTGLSLSYPHVIHIIVDNIMLINYLLDNIKFRGNIKNFQ